MGHPNSLPAGIRCEKHGRIECGAWHAKIQATCHNQTKPGKRCKFDGNSPNQPKGLDHPGFKHGRYSEVLPQRMRAAFERSMLDKDLPSMLSEMALLDVRMTELARKLGTDDSARIWRDLKAAYQLSKSDKPDEAALGRTQMDQLIVEGDADRRLWADLLDVMLVRTKLADTETKRMTQLKMMVPVERVIVLMHAVADSVTRNVTDPKQVEAVKRDLEMWMGPPATAKELEAGIEGEEPE